MLLNEDMVISVNALEFICQKALCDYFNRINPKEKAGHFVKRSESKLLVNHQKVPAISMYF